MLPVALTCPLWWVARWASRLLAGLALLVGLALTAGSTADAAHPTGPAAAAATQTLPVRASASSGCCVTSARADAPAALRWAASGVAPAAAADAAPGWSGADVPPAAAPQAGAGVLPSGPEVRPVAGRLPATSGPRAPPLR